MAKKLFIGGLDASTTAKDLRKVFKTYGDVTDVKVIVDKYQGKGYGFIVFDDDEDALEAASKMNGRKVYGVKLRVEFPKRIAKKPAEGLAIWALRHGYRFEGFTALGSRQGGSGGGGSAALPSGGRRGRTHRVPERRGTVRVQTRRSARVPAFGKVVHLGSKKKSAKPSPKRARPGVSSRKGLPPASAAPVLPSAESLDDRAMNVWIEELTGKPRPPLAAGKKYTACMSVGDVVEGNLLGEEERSVPLADIPPEGLATNWIVSSGTVRMEVHPDEKDVEVQRIAGTSGEPDRWTARFALLIPREGDTPIRRIRISRVAEAVAALDIVVMTVSTDTGPHARSPEVYRELHVDLDSGSSKEFCHSPAAHLGLRPKRESFTPSETLTVRLVPPYAFVDGSSGGKQVNDSVTWSPSEAALNLAIQQVRTALEDLRVAHQDYFNALDETELIGRWDNAYFPSDWASPHANPRQADIDRWQSVAVSRELWTLAVRGYALLQELFPAKTKLRGWIDGLLPGARLNLYYMKGAAPWISHVPWALCHRSPPPPSVKPIDPREFLGIRLRLAYVAHPIEGSKALGPRESATLANLLYWGTGAGDETAAEADRQRVSLPRDWGENAVSVPRQAIDRKTDLLAYLRAPDPSPVALLYVFCQCKAVPGADPSLRFDATPDAENIVDTIDLPLDALTDQPLVFLNACDTAAADSYSVNRLEQVFFDRECRAFIGSECKVPIQLAGRFAELFLRSLCGATPASAGESFAQARRFLWDEYRNLGGLFYAYVNQYELFLGSDAEVAALRTL